MSNIKLRYETSRIGDIRFNSLPGNCFFIREEDSGHGGSRELYFNAVVEPKITFVYS